MAVNSSRGVISYQIYDSAVNEEIFLQFLEKMSLAMGEEPFALFMDRLTVHRMITVKEKMLKLGIFPIYNIPASPETNAIETCFAQCKLTYKRQRLNALVNEQNFDIEEGISEALDVITPELVKACAKRSIYKLHNMLV